MMYAVSLFGYFFPTVFDNLGDTYTRNMSWMSLRLQKKPPKPNSPTPKKNKQQRSEQIKIIKINRNKNFLYIINFFILSHIWYVVEGLMTLFNS